MLAIWNAVAGVSTLVSYFNPVLTTCIVVIPKTRRLDASLHFDSVTCFHPSSTSSGLLCSRPTKAEQITCNSCFLKVLYEHGHYSAVARIAVIFETRSNYLHPDDECFGQLFVATIDQVTRRQTDLET